MIWDQTQDVSGADTHVIFSVTAVPQFVKAANEEQLRGDEKLAAHMYGDSVKRRFPTHTPAATWLSTAFLHMKAAEYEPAYVKRVQSVLDKAASFWGILPAVRQVQDEITKEAADQLTQLPDSSFALVWKYDDGSVERNYPLRNRSEVEKAAEWFCNYRNDFEFNDRHMIAGRILEKAASFDLRFEDEQEDILQKTAGNGVGPVADVCDLLNSRANQLYTRNSAVANEFSKIANVLEQAPGILDKAARLELAQHIDTIDRRYGFAREYGKTVDRPEDCLFGITQKTAQALEQAHVRSSSGAIYEKEQLDRLSGCDLEAWMGTKMAEEYSIGAAFVNVEKLAAALPEFSREDAEMFDKMAAASGISPAAIDRRREPGMTAQEKAELATLYSLD
jgi:hypothetical protein